MRTGPELDLHYLADGNRQRGNLSSNVPASAHEQTRGPPRNTAYQGRQQTPLARARSRLADGDLGVEAGGDGGQRDGPRGDDAGDDVGLLGVVRQPRRVRQRRRGAVGRHLELWCFSAERGDPRRVWPRREKGGHDVKWAGRPWESSRREQISRPPGTASPVPGERRGPRAFGSMPSQAAGQKGPVGGETRFEPCWRSRLRDTPGSQGTGWRSAANGVGVQWPIAPRCTLRSPPAVRSERRWGVRLCGGNSSRRLRPSAVAGRRRYRAAVRDDLAPGSLGRSPPVLPSASDPAARGRYDPGAW